jgi:hypothetical protein
MRHPAQRFGRFVNELSESTCLENFFESAPIRGTRNQSLTMFALLFVGVVFTLALAVTLYAFASAKDGYEDLNGFHASFQTPPQFALSNKTPKRPHTPLAVAN